MSSKVRRYGLRNTAIGAYLLFAGVLVSSPAFAVLMVETVTPVATSVGGYSMTGFVAPGPDGSVAQQAVSDDGDVVNFTGKNGAALPSNVMAVGDNTTDADDWWSGATGTFYYAPFSGGSPNVNWLELIMPDNTFAFSLTIDASDNANAWIVAVDNNGNGIDTEGSNYVMDGSGSFTPNPGYTIPLTGAAQSFGFSADNSSYAPGGACTTISKVVIDPKYWGMGDFSISVNDNGCTSVPEPGTLSLLGVGLLGLGMRRFRRAS